MACLQTKRQEWAIRLEHELKVSKSAHFVTLTYTQENLRYGLLGIPSLDKRDCQLFIKRLRKRQKEKIRYYLVGEYGSNSHRPHYHVIFFNLAKKDDELYAMLLDTWQLGNVHIGKATPASINYTCKYVIQKQEEYKGIQSPFALMSKKPAIGSAYVEKLKHYHRIDTERNYVTKPGGTKVRMPRYYREKLYDPMSRKVQGIKQQIVYDEKEAKEMESDAKSSSDGNPFTLKAQRKEAYKKLMESRLKNNSKF